MIKSILHHFIRKFESRYQYDCGYQHELLSSTGPGTYLKFAWVQGMSSHCQGLPKEAWFAARLQAMKQEDCGPCTQLTIKMAEEAEVSPQVLKAVVVGDWDSLDEDTALSVKYVQAVAARGLEAEELREEVRARFGPEGLVTLAYAITSAKLYPALKYSLGYGQECSRLKVGGEMLGVHGR